MLHYPNINPTIFKLGPLEVRWYGVLYIVGFFIAFLFYKKFLKYRETSLSKEIYEDLLFYLMIGVIVGGRLGYIIFYNLPFYLKNPLELFAVWHGGMSFHGGVLGVITFGYIFKKKHKLDFFQLADPLMPLVAIGLGLGRLGNFINAELYGRVTTVPWGMIFPNTDGRPRHPSQLYESFLEGLMLFLLTWIILKKTKRNGVVFFSWIGLYGVFRFFVEFFREPDSQLGFVFLKFTQGQMLSSVMIIVGIIGVIYVYRKP
jgi:phosphatidylglycerol:prolipoprotein diacylglycerol transferase